MDPSKRVVTHLPLTELWTESASLEAVSCGSLGKSEIVQLLREGNVCFVVADVGKKLQWIPKTDCFKFWKREVLPHLVEVESQVQLGHFPGNYCYFASEWRSEDEHKIVVLERAH